MGQNSKDVNQMGMLEFEQMLNLELDNATRIVAAEGCNRSLVGMRMTYDDDDDDHDHNEHALMAVN